MLMKLRGTFKVRLFQGQDWASSNNGGNGGVGGDNGGGGEYCFVQFVVFYPMLRFRF